MLISALPMYGRVTLEERMIEAVGQTDIALLRKLMKKFNRDSLSLVEKKKALLQVHASCADVIQATENPSMLSSVRDTTSFLGGAVTGVFGLSYLAYYGQQLRGSRESDRSWLLAKALGAVGLTCFGLHNIVNGLRKTFQRQMHETARRIEDYLENCVRELDIPSKGGIS